MSDRCHAKNGFGFLGTVPRESRDRQWCVTVLSGGDDERNWSQRYKANLEKLASRDLVQVVEVVRDLTGREASRGLPAGEKRMLANARLILLQEG
jgi:CarD family transcriptional regulator